MAQHFHDVPSGQAAVPDCRAPSDFALTFSMLRRFEETDLEPCVNLFRATFAQAPWNEEWKPEVVQARLDQIIKTPHFLGVVAGDSSIRGFAMGFSEPWHEGTHFYLKEMCIDHTRQRQGLGTKLLEFLSSELRERDSRRIYLLTARGDVSEAFYTKAGFYTSPRMILMARRSESLPQIPS
jgi:aminoglycoside 6'-N-acetyltransferase I